MDKKLFEKMKLLKRKYEPKGFIIVGVFGSFARGEETTGSDIDILYQVDERFYQKYSGWEAAEAIQNVKSDLESELHRKIDLADQSALGKVGKKYILSELRHVG